MTSNAGRNQQTETDKTESNTNIELNQTLKIIENHNLS